MFKLKKEVDGTNEKIKYIDVCSLYPTVMYYDYYAIGHPTKIFKPSQYDPNWYGMIKCKVLPPKGLYIPVLACKVAEKLVFALCSKCVEERKEKCNHSDKEREMIGTWTTDEINKAVEKGYRIIEIYEVWNMKRSRELWKGYINDFMKIKLETSPHNYPSVEEYVRDIKEKMGIELDINNCGPNPGKRQVSKICLNSLWGKFGQRQNVGNTEFVADVSRFYDLLLDDRLTDVNILFLNDNMVQINYKFKDYYIENNYNTNIFVAVFTTSNARLRLYEQLEKLDRAVLYCDTDSIVYVDNGVNSVQTGEMLGEWTDEIGSGVHIDKFLSTGPKSYYYHTNNGKEITKVKGFTLNYTNLQKINGQSLEKLIDREIHKRNITRDRQTKQLVNKDQTKTLSFGFDKRVIAVDFDTFPYGF